MKQRRTGPIVCGAILALMMTGCSSPSPSGCTVFTVSKGEQVFFGGNDDYIKPDSYYWVDPGDPHGYGAIWVGTPDDVQQGVNEKGLAYDANGLPSVNVDPHPERTPVAGGYTSYPIQMLHECATVEEVITWVNTHQWHSFMRDQMQFADATGDAVIISAGEDGELVFTRKSPGDGYLVSSNFNVAHPANGYSYPCWRYDTAQERLGGLLERGGKLTAQDATNVLDAVHVEGGTSWTIESLVADLPRGIVYLYYFYQYDRPVVLNVAEEIANARAGGPLSALFPEDIRQEAAHRYMRIQGEKSRCLIPGKVWLGLVLASLAVLLVGSINKRRGTVFWLPVVVILGPLGLLIWLVAGRSRGTGTWRAVPVEAVGDLTPTVVAFMIYLVAAIQIPSIQASQPLQILFVFCLPLLFGWLLFQGPLLARATRKGYWRTLVQRLPHAWVAANLGMAGISAVAMPLVNRNVRTCMAIPLPPWTVAGWWAFVVVGAVVAMLLLLVYEVWVVRRGFRAWSVLALGDGEVSTPTWRKLWWWILLSDILLIGGVAAGVLIQQVFPR